MDEVEELVQVSKAFSDPTRLRLLQLLRENQSPTADHGQACHGHGFLCVNAMAHRLGVTQSAVSQHLRVLKQVGLVNRERHGSFVHYSLDAERVRRHAAMLESVLGIALAGEG